MALQRPLSPYPGMPEDEHAHLLERAYRKAAHKIQKELLGTEGGKITLTRLTPQVRETLSAAWNDQAQLKRYHHGPDDVAVYREQCFYNDLNGRPVLNANRDPQRFEVALWADEQLCAIAFGRQIDTIYTYGISRPVRAVWVNQVAAAPTQHPLKGKTLRAVHEVASAYAQVAKASHILYLGPFSPGSIAQVERGAIPITERNRVDMWKGESIHAPARVTNEVRPFIFKPGSALPSTRISPKNEGVYQKLFHQPYVRPL